MIESGGVEMADHDLQSISDTVPTQQLWPLPRQPVDRLDQIQRFGDILDRIRRRRPVATNLIEWHGSPGIGKTIVIDLLVQKCQEENVPFAKIDFKRQLQERRDMYLKDPTTLIEDLVSGLSVSDQVSLAALRAEIQTYRAQDHPVRLVRAYFEMSPDDRLYNRPEWLEKLRGVQARFVEIVGNLAQSDQEQTQPVAFFFDETEYADVELADWIEEWLVNPLVQMKHCVVVWTARRPWRWKRPEIRRRLYSEALQVFTLEDVRQQFELNSSQPNLAKSLFKSVHVVSGGHPSASAVVISQIDDLAASGQALTPETFAGREPDFLGEVYERFIQKYVFHRVEPDVKTACELLSMVRLFDTTMLKAILQTCAGRRFAQWRQEDFGELMLQLKKTQFLVWNNGYALEPTLRHIIREYFIACEQPIYLDVNRAALNVYRDWLSRPVDNRNLFIMEELYHLASLSRVGEQVDLAGVLDKRLQEYPMWIKDKKAQRLALERLEGELERDSELAQLISQDSSAQLVQQAKASLDRVASSQD